MSTIGRGGVGTIVVYELFCSPSFFVDMAFFSKRTKRSSPDVLLRPRRSRTVQKRPREESSSPSFPAASVVWAWWYAFLWASFFVAAFFVAFFSPLLRVKEYRIIGTHTVSKEAVENRARLLLEGKFAGLFPRNSLPLVFLRRREILRTLEADFPIFREAKLSIVFPETIELLFGEREQRFLLCSGGPCFRIDERGEAFDSAPPLSSSGESAVSVLLDTSGKAIVRGSRSVSESFAREFPEAASQLREALGIETEKVVETPSRLSNEMRFRTTEGWQLLLSADIPLEKSLLALRLFFSKTLSPEDRSRLDYVDLRTEKKIFYMLKGEEQKDSESTSEQDSEKKSKEEKQTKKKK